MQSLRSYFLPAVVALSVFATSFQPVIGASASTYTVQGNVYRVVEYVSSDANEIKVSTVVKGSAANEPYAARVVPIKQSRLLSWFKPNAASLVKSNLWWMGFVAVVESAGWAIDELKGQVVVPDPAYQLGYYYAIYYGQNQSFTDSTKDGVCKKYAGLNPGYISRVDGNKCYANFPGGGSSGVTIYKPQCGGGSTLASCTGVGIPTNPVSDADLQAAINSQLAADPAHAATAFTDPATGKGYADLFDPVPYIPGLTAADEALVNCYIGGQLQMVNSQTACYVATQAEYDRVKQQADFLAAGKTPDGVADALNSDMKQPLTQTQYEESNKKYSDSVADVTASVDAQNKSDYSDMDEHFNKLDDFVADLPNSTLPTAADISVPQYVDCQQLTLTDGNGHELVFPSASQCAKIDAFKQGFGYFLGMGALFLLLMQLLTRPHG